MGGVIVATIRLVMGFATNQCEVPEVLHEASAPQCLRAGAGNSGTSTSTSTSSSSSSCCCRRRGRRANINKTRCGTYIQQLNWNFATAIMASICTVTFAAKGSLSFYAFRVHIPSPTSCIYRRTKSFHIYGTLNPGPSTPNYADQPHRSAGFRVQLRPFSLRRLPAHRPEKRTQGPHADRRETIAALVAVRVYSI